MYNSVINILLHTSTSGFSFLNLCRDEFILEESGLGRIVGRKKDVIIRGGENIYPKEIEDFLDTHDDILESQVHFVEL